MKLKKFGKFLVFILILAVLGGAFYFITRGSDNGGNDDDDDDDDIIIPTTYSVVFNLNEYYGSVAPTTQTVAPDALVSEPTDPVRVGYDFDGWYLTDQNDLWDFSTDTVGANSTLYAKWTLQHYTVSFDITGGVETAPATQTGTYLDKLAEPDFNTGTSTIDDPTSSTGLTFAGWWIKDGSNYVQEWNFSSDLLNSNMTLYAAWGTLMELDLNSDTITDLSYISLGNCVKIMSYLTHGNTNSPADEDLVLPNTIGTKPVVSIGKRAFQYVNGATNIVLPSGLKTIGESAFSSCDSLTDITIPSGVTSIGKQAFYSCDNLYDITFGNAIKNFGEKAFYQCTELFTSHTSTLTIPASVLKIEKEAFCITSVAGNIFNLTLNNGLQVIEESAFIYARILILTVPNTVTEIQKFAFEYCAYLTKIEFGLGISSIGQDAFYGCYENLYIIFRSNTPPTLGSVAVFGPYYFTSGVANRSHFFITVNAAAVEAYKTAENWSVYYDEAITTYEFSDIVYPNRP